MAGDWASMITAIVWTRPQRPTRMDQETYDKIPERLELREIRFNVVEPGRRTRTLDIITTLVDADQYTKEDIAELYAFRWNSELDIRCIEASLNLRHVRCKSPEMVHREVWTTIRGYKKNLHDAKNRLARFRLMVCAQAAHQNDAFPFMILSSWTR